MTVLLATLREMRAMRTKQEAISYIQTQGWLDLRPEDWKPLESQTEPRWHSMIAWARMDCVNSDLMFHHDENDHWEITREGLDKFEQFRGRFSREELDVRRCYLWSRAFKRFMNPTYEPSERDHTRPDDIAFD